MLAGSALWYLPSRQAGRLQAQVIEPGRLAGGAGRHSLVAGRAPARGLLLASLPACLPKYASPGLPQHLKTRVTFLLAIQLIWNLFSGLYLSYL